MDTSIRLCQALEGELSIENHKNQKASFIVRVGCSLIDSNADSDLIRGNETKIVLVSKD